MDGDVGTDTAIPEFVFVCPRLRDLKENQDLPDSRASQELK